MSNQTIINDDCLNILKNLPDESFDLVISDIPYKIATGGVTINIKNTGGILGKKTTKDRLKNKWLKQADSEDNDILIKKGKFFEHVPEFENWLPQIYRVLKPKSHCYLMVNGRNLSQLQIQAEKVGFKFQNLLVWAKQNATPNKFYMQKCEFILMLRKGRERYINDMGVENIFFVRNPAGKKLHPTEKPVELMKKLIEQSTNIGDKVLDPFMGAGATLIACEEIHRLGTGIEIEKRFCDIAQKRIDQTKQNYVQGSLLI